MAKLDGVEELIQTSLVDYVPRIVMAYSKVLEGFETSHVSILGVSYLVN